MVEIYNPDGVVADCRAAGQGAEKQNIEHRTLNLKPKWGLV